MNFGCCFILTCGVVDMGLQPCADQEDFHRRSRLKIRTAPSCKISAAATSSSHCSASSHSSSSRQTNKKGWTRTIVSQPLIFHTFDPEVIVAEPAAFMSVVQRLTGSPQTRRLLRVSMMETTPMVRQVLDVKSMAQQDPSKEGTPIILTPITTGCSNGDVSTNDSTRSPTCPNPSELSKSPSHLSQLPSANQVSYKTNPSDLSKSSSHLSQVPSTNQLSYKINPLAKKLNFNTNHPLSTISASSDVFEENARQAPSSPSCAYTSPMSSNSPHSPHSGLTTSSLEGYHTDTSLPIGEKGASSYREALSCLVEQRDILEEDGSINFFVFSRDSYYGSSHAAQD